MSLRMDLINLKKIGPEAEKAARMFKVLSVETRVKMIELLKQRSFCVNALAKLLNMTSAAVSQHLRVLRDADLVIAEKQGYFVHYRLNEATLAAWREIAKGVLEPGQ
jgi:ArsR family transcriptional regulator, arsenate/arsenite/antimonite-responsive transcriptional repressor